MQYYYLVDALWNSGNHYTYFLFGRLSDGSGRGHSGAFITPGASRHGNWNGASYAPAEPNVAATAIFHGPTGAAAWALQSPPFNNALVKLRNIRSACHIPGEHGVLRTARGPAADADGCRASFGIPDDDGTDTGTCIDIDATTGITSYAGGLKGVPIG